MKVSNHNTTNTSVYADSSIELKVGDGYIGTIKERLSKDEAIVQIRGRDVHVKFEDGVPKGDRVAIQITGTEERMAIAKIVKDALISSTHSLDIDMANLLKSLGMNATPVLKQAIHLAMTSQIPVNTKAVHILNHFLENAKGTEQQKLNTIQALLTKNVEINHQNLNAIHIALNKKSLTELFAKITPNSEQKLDLLTQVQQMISKHHGSIEVFMPLPEAIEASVANQQRNTETMIRTEYSGKPSLSGDKALDINQTSQNNVQNTIAQPGSQMPSEKMTDTTKNDRIQVIQSFVRSSMEEVLNITKNLQEYEDNDYLHNFPNLPAKEFIEATVTQKLAEVTEQFRHVQREIVRNLDNLQLAIQQARVNILPQVKPLLENTIDLIDKAILKSDITLFTDMKTEKTLLQSSSQLADARRLLAKGDYVGARQIIEEVKTTIRNLDFRPVEVKVQHYIAKEIFHTQPATAEQHVRNQLEQIVYNQPIMNPSSKAAFELIRSLGLNYDSEAAQSLSLRPEQMNQEELQRNLKAALLQVLKGEQESHSQARSNNDMQQALNHLTGQQLLSKADVGSNLQSMFFNIPVPLGKHVENLQVFINSKQDGQKIDWENCSIYFLIETKKMGETGILLTATDRNLAITLKNDQENFRAKIEPLVSKYKDRFKEIGYNVKGMQFTKLNPEIVDQPLKVENKQITNPSSMSSKKGFDFKI